MRSFNCLLVALLVFDCRSPLCARRPRGSQEGRRPPAVAEETADLSPDTCVCRLMCELDRVRCCFCSDALKCVSRIMLTCRPDDRRDRRHRRHRRRARSARRSAKERERASGQRGCRVPTVIYYNLTGSVYDDCLSVFGGVWRAVFAAGPPVAVAADRRVPVRGRNRRRAVHVPTCSVADGGEVISVLCVPVSIPSGHPLSPSRAGLCRLWTS